MIWIAYIASLVLMRVGLDDRSVYGLGFVLNVGCVCVLAYLLHTEARAKNG